MKGHEQWLTLSYANSRQTFTWFGSKKKIYKIVRMAVMVKFCKTYDEEEASMIIQV